jgi:hypothetical protein
MEYRTQDTPPALASALAFFDRLNAAGVHYGIFKSSRNTLVALAGDQDLDILVARRDYCSFCAIAGDSAGIRSANHVSLVSAGREDWFIPDFEWGKYLHLDVHTAIRLGGKFNKRYPFLNYEDIRRWNHVLVGSCSIPIVSSEDEAAITLSRLAFRAPTLAFGSWQKVRGTWAEELDELLFNGSGEIHARCPVVGDPPLGCQVERRGEGIVVRRADLAAIRRMVTARRGAAVYATIADLLVNAFAATRYSAARLLNRMSPGLTIDRRRPARGGLLVAMIAPDGMGKTTQVARMWRLFDWKFSCARLYLGTGDGEGWWLRRAIRSLYLRRRTAISASIDEVGEGTARRGIRSKIIGLLLSLWGALTALERYMRVRAARRMADRGVIVICDRWPQSLQAGLMDGPSRPAGNRPNLFRRWELSLYERMSRVPPDLTVHLMGDYETAETRKPGELTRDAFERRIALMRRLQATTPQVQVVDAGADIDQVSKSVFRLIWQSL